jgi:two-component system invasion response regulator UvrY
MQPRILLADDHSMIRKGVRSLCEKTLGFENLGEASSCKEVVKELEMGGYTHLVLDINFSDGSSLEILPAIRQSHPDLRIAILSMQPASVYMNAFRQYGVYYFINKESQPEDTSKLLRNFFRNEIPMRNSLANTESKNPFSSLAPRELQILHHWLKGAGTKEIASLMSLTMSTISTVKANILEKTSSANFVELTKKAEVYKTE